MDKKQKQYVYIGGGALVLYLGYRLYTNSKNANTSNTGVSATPDTAAADYAALAGQQQSDVAGLQSQQDQMFTQLLAAITANQSQEQQDVAGLQGQYAGVAGVLSGITDTLGSVGSELNLLANQPVPTATPGAAAVPGPSVPAVATGSTPVSVSQLNKGQPAGPVLHLAPRPPTVHPRVAHPNAGHKPATTHAKKTEKGGKVILVG